MKQKKTFKIIQDDPWLEHSYADIEARYQRYKDRLNEIESLYGSIKEFANAYTFLGINYNEGEKGWYYREWAPQAKALFLTGDFNNWEEFSCPLKKKDSGIWEVFLADELFSETFKEGGKLKVIVDGNNGLKWRIPAYIQRVYQDEATKDFCGIIQKKNPFNWTDKSFIPPAKEQLFIYEAHIGMATEEESVGTYEDFNENILPRIAASKYTAIQLMAIQEHPYYGSFGYHVSNFFAPSSRFGSPEDLKRLINRAHELGLAVIMDIVHSHSVKNTVEGLNMFDGSDQQYFHQGSRGEHPDWDSKLFDYGKTEVLQFLLSNIRYWIEEFHFDGFRFDGVGSMMYFHHGNESIDSREKYFTNGVEWDAVSYLQLANHLAHELKPSFISIAEDVTGMPGLTYKADDGGLGFDYRLGMGIPDFWIKIIKEQKDEDWDIYMMWKVLNDRLPNVKTIAYCESHDQALVGDKTLAFRLMDKEMYFHMQKDDENHLIDRGLALHKMIRLFTIALGGEAYLNFMGNEFAHPEWIDFPREGNLWSYKYARRQWSLADDPKLKYSFMLDFDREMINMAREYSLFSHEFASQINMDPTNKTIIFKRADLIFVFNFHPHNSIGDYAFSSPDAGVYQLILSTDDAKYGGFGRNDDSIPYPAVYDPQTKTAVMIIYNTNRTAQVFRKENS